MEARRRERGDPVDLSDMVQEFQAEAQAWFSQAHRLGLPLTPADVEIP
jgi:hypothetical protein